MAEKQAPTNRSAALIETKSQRIARNFDNLQRHGETDSSELEWLLDELHKARVLLKACLGDYGHIGFTDRHGMADRIRNRLGLDADGREIAEAVE